MSHIWTFSPSSEPYLQRCLAAASLQQTENKWMQKFGSKNSSVTNIETDTFTNNTPVEITAISLPRNETENEKTSPNFEDFFESIQNELKLDIITKEYSKTPEILSEMVKRLSANNVEKLFNLIFAANQLENSFLTAIFLNFLPAYLKLHYSWFCIEILTKSSEKYPELFQKLLKTLLEDTEIPNQVINNYITAFSEDKNTIFMNQLMNTEMSSEIFKHNLLIIYTVYKDCTKTDSIQNYIKTCLVQHSNSCTSDRNYGRLFLTYLQTVKLLESTVNVKQLEVCLEIHSSPFKRPCLMILKEFADN